LTIFRKFESFSAIFGKCVWFFIINRKIFRKGLRVPYLSARERGGLNYVPSPTMGTFSSTAIEIIYRLKIAVAKAKAKVFPHLEYMC
jgi:hypothetical protein